MFITPKGAREEAQATGVDRTGPSLSFEPTAARHQQAANQHEAIPFNDEHHKRNGQPSSTGRAGKAPPRQSTIN